MIDDFFLFVGTLVLWLMRVGIIVVIGLAIFAVFNHIVR